MSSKLQIFVSSTFTDLKEERQAAVEAILRMGHIPAGMELFAAGDNSQWEEIKKWIEDSDVYMLILGGRYGSIMPGTEDSYTEHEFNYAMSLNKPIFSIIISDEFLAKKKDGDNKVVETESKRKHSLFKSKVMNKICREFNNIEGVKSSVMETLSNFQRRTDLVGWVRADSIDNTKYITRINELLEINQKLSEENKSLNLKFSENKATIDLFSEDLNLPIIKLEDMEIKIATAVEYLGMTIDQYGLSREECLYKLASLSETVYNKQNSPQEETEEYHSVNSLAMLSRLLALNILKLWPDNNSYQFTDKGALVFNNIVVRRMKSEDKPFIF